MGFYDLSVMAASGDEISMKDYEGKVVLIVNTATGCGFTPHYKDIEEMYEKFHDKIAEMGKNPMADKINRVVRSLTYALRLQTVSTMITTGREDELIETHRQLLEAIRKKDKHSLSSKVRGSYFEEEIKAL